MKLIITEEAELIALLEKIVGPLKSEIAELRATVKSLVNNKRLMNRNEVGEFLGITHKQVASISYEKGEKPTNRKQTLACEIVGSRYLYESEQVVAYKNKYAPSPAEAGRA
jgi:hypothetical protein